MVCGSDIKPTNKNQYTKKEVRQSFELAGKRALFKWNNWLIASDKKKQYYKKQLESVFCEVCRNDLMERLIYLIDTLIDSLRNPFKY